MQFLAGFFVFEPFFAGAERNFPRRAHLHVVVHRLHRLVVKRIFRFRVLRRPDERFVRVGKARAFEVRHRVGLVPHDVVQNPEPQILHDVADAEDVVIRADDPYRAVFFEDAARLAHPCLGVAVVLGNALKAVPFFIDALDVGIVGAFERVAELQVIRRVGKNHVYRIVGDFLHGFHAIRINNSV